MKEICHKCDHIPFRTTSKNSKNLYPLSYWDACHHERGNRPSRFYWLSTRTVRLPALQLRFLLLSERYSFPFSSHSHNIFSGNTWPELSPWWCYIRHFPVLHSLPAQFHRLCFSHPENLHNVICGNIRYINLHTISSFSFFYLSKVLLQYASISYLLFNTFFICTFNSYLHHTFILHICQYIFLILRTCNSFYFMLYYPWGE